MTKGLPHDSGLIPLLFIIPCICSFIIDDIALYFASKSLVESFSNLNFALRCCKNYMDSLKVKLAPNKSYAMILSKSSKMSSINEKNLKFMLNCIEIKSVKSLKFLGIIIDQN